MCASEGDWKELFDNIDVDPRGHTEDLHRHILGKISDPIDGKDIRVVDKQTGELLRELTLDTTRDYQR